MQGRHYAGAGRPPIALVLVAALHVGFIYLFNEALGLRSLLSPPPKRMVATVIQEPKPILQERVVPDIKPQEIPQTVLSDLPPPDVITEDVVQMEAVPDPVPSVPDPPVIGTPEPELSHSPVTARTPLTRPEYPPISRRNGEEGTVELAVLVLRDGKVAEVRVARSSGYPRLDRAAVDEVRRRWRLEPARKGDVAIDEWGRFRVVFQITDR